MNQNTSNTDKVHDTTRILGLLNDDALNSNQIAQLLDKPIQPTRQLLTHLKNKGDIIVQEKRNGLNYYTRKEHEIIGYTEVYFEILDSFEMDKKIGVGTTKALKEIFLIVLETKPNDVMKKYVEYKRESLEKEKTNGIDMYL